MKDFFELISALAVMLIFVLSIVFIPVEFLSRKNCETYHGQTGRETKYINWDGCYIMGNGAWYTRSEYEATITAKDAISKENN